MPDLSGTMRKCRIGTAKNFTLLLLLYITQPKSQGMKQFMANQREQKERKSTIQTVSAAGYKNKL